MNKEIFTEIYLNKNVKKLVSEIGKGNISVCDYKRYYSTYLLDILKEVKINLEISKEDYEKLVVWGEGITLKEKLAEEVVKNLQLITEESTTISSTNSWLYSVELGGIVYIYRGYGIEYLGKDTKLASRKKSDLEMNYLSSNNLYDYRYDELYFKKFNIEDLFNFIRTRSKGEIK